MIVVEYGDKRPLVILRDSKNGNSRNEDVTDGESDTSFEERPCKTASQNRKYIGPDDSSGVLSLANDRIGVAKHDFERYHWKITTNKGSNTDALCEESDSERRKEDVEEMSKTRKKRKRRFLTICTANCKYDVVRRVAARFGMREVTEDSSWDIYWTDLNVSVERAKDMRRFQRVNHFPGMTEICRKDLLARNLNRMQKLFPKDYNFFPKTWCFPADHGDATVYAKTRRSRTFILKPDTGCQGRGIYLTKHLKDIKPSERLICQVYIARPFLIDGYKFDLRIYALITSCDPLRIYVYNEGLARFATSKYKEPTGYNISNMFMHLTNYSVNKYSRMYIIDDEIGSKRKISTLNKWLKVRDVDVDELWSKIDEIIIKTVIAAYPVLKHSYHACFSMHNKTCACFELLGFDILLDWKLKPYLLEVNHSPSFHTDAQIDKDVKEGLLMDTFDILNLQRYDKKKIIEEDRKRIRERLLQGLNGKDLSQINDTAALMKSERNENDYMQRQFQWEDDHMGNFRRIYPCFDKDKYQPFFTQNALSVFQDTVASRAREEASRIEREENELKAREEERKRIVGKWNEQKLGPESSNAPKKLQEKSKSAGVMRKIINKQDAQGSPTNALYSFEPEIISESEERERITALAQRDFLIKSYGMLEQIYVAMKRNGMLRPADERKYGLYGRLGLQANTSHSTCSSSHKPDNRQNGHLNATQPAVDQCLQCSLRKNEHKLTKHQREFENSNKSKRRRNFIIMSNILEIVAQFCTRLKSLSLNSGLWITCNEAMVYVRPKIPQKLWTEEMSSNNHMGRVTKTHVARTLSNTVRLHTLERRESFHSAKSKVDVTTQH
ncbi:tubulin polyglutamylase TTLL13-like isoform X2 [Temnothorax longispinosus]|uniref:tubulin polyglutamylase TTLL13-like isoform X2 n=1 Tax=Temnothorax longispinosus TaxID=300112 RepID=UPI003A99DEA3